MIEFAKIIGLSIAAAVMYGVLHDQVTARVCLEYFTVGHPMVFPTTSPTLLALGWGVIATWWAGAMVGIPAACCARIGQWPKLTAHELVRPVAVLLLMMGLAAAIAGATAYQVALRGQLTLKDPLSRLVPTDRHAAFIACGATHLASYVAGFVGGIAVSGWILVTRRSRSRKAVDREFVTHDQFTRSAD